MIYQHRIKIVLALIIAILIGLGIVGFRIYMDGQFRVTSITPNKVLPTSLSLIDITFNRPLLSEDKQDENSILLLPDTKFYTTIQGNTVRIELRERLKNGDKLTVKLNGLKSFDAESITKEFTFSIKTIPFGELDKKTQDLIVQTSTLTGDNNPLLSKLPFDNLTFKVSSVIDQAKYGAARDWKDEKDNYTVVVTTYASDSGVTPEVYKSRTIMLRQKALDWIKEQGVDPDKDIRIIYVPSDQQLDGAPTEGRP